MFLHKIGYFLYFLLSLVIYRACPPSRPTLRWFPPSDFVPHLHLRYDVVYPTSSCRSVRPCWGWHRAARVVGQRGAHSHRTPPRRHRPSSSAASLPLSSPVGGPMRQPTVSCSAVEAASSTYQMISRLGHSIGSRPHTSRLDCVRNPKYLISPSRSPPTGGPLPSERPQGAGATLQRGA